MRHGDLVRVLAVAVLALALALVATAQPLRDADGSCTMFPPDSPLRRDVSSMGVHPDSE